MSTFNPNGATIDDWHVHLDEMHEAGDEWAPLLIRALSVPMHERHRLTLVRMLYELATARNAWVQSMALGQASHALRQVVEQARQALSPHPLIEADGGVTWGPVVVDVPVVEPPPDATWPHPPVSHGVLLAVMGEQQADFDELVAAFGPGSVRNRHVNRLDDGTEHVRWELRLAHHWPLDLPGWSLTPHYVMPDGTLQVFAERSVCVDLQTTAVRLELETKRVLHEYDAPEADADD